MLPPGLEPWTFLIEQAHSTQNLEHLLELPALDIANEIIQNWSPDTLKSRFWPIGDSQEFASALAH